MVTVMVLRRLTASTINPALPITHESRGWT